MQHEDFKRSVDAKISAMEQQLAKLKTFRAGLDDPDITAILGAQNGRVHEVSAQSKLKFTDRAHGTVTHFSKIRDFFRSNGNQWASQREILGVANVTKNGVSTVLYSRNKDAFEKQRSSEGVNQWKLKPEYAV